MENSKKDLKKKHQKNEIIKLLYLYPGLTNAKLVSKTGLSLPTVSQLLNELSNDGYIGNIGIGESSGGRRPTLLGLKPNAFYTIAIDMERYSARIALINSVNKVVHGPKQFNLNIYDKDTTVNILVDQINKFTNELNIEQSRLIGVGISLPGLTNSDKGVNYNFLNFGEISISNILEEKTNIPVYIINDAQARALAELRFGKAKTVENALVIYIGWGLGTGLILNGKLYQGVNGFSGEFSHIPIIENGILCHCGKRGCLETVASGTALERLAHEGIARGEDSDLVRTFGKHPKHIHYMAIVESALKGDSFAIDLLSEIGTELGRGIAMLVQILNPELIIFGGKMLKAGHFLTIPIEHSLNKYCLNDLRASLKIDISEIGEEASLLGAVINVSENYFSKTK